MDNHLIYHSILARLVNCRIKYVILLLLFQLVGYRGVAQSVSFVNHTELGPLIGKRGDQERRVNFSIQSFNGVRPHPHHEVGFVIGWDSYPGFSLMPLALGWRGILNNNRRASLYGSLDIGHGSAWATKRVRLLSTESWYEGGLLVSPAVGIRKKSRSGKNTFSWSVGFKKQKASYSEGSKAPVGTAPPPDGNLPPGFINVWNESYIMNSLYVKWGMVF